MKLYVPQKTRQLGAALLVAMCISAFLCICITGYLSLAEHQNYMSARSQAWNIAMSVTEAGVEEGLAQLNCNYTNLSSNGWSLDSASGSYYRTNYLPDGNGYTVNIYTTNAAVPVIIARAYTIPPTLAQNASSVFFAAYGSTTVPQTTVTRAVQVSCTRGNLFLAALVARHGIELNGNGVLTDSFDSSNPAKSTNGKYDSAKYTGDMGDISSNGGISDSLNLGNGNVYGKVHISPSAPLSIISVGKNGGVGTHVWQLANAGKGAQPGYEIQDANFTFPETPLPDTSSGYLGLPPGGTNISTTYTPITVVTNAQNAPPTAGTYTGTFTSNNVTSGPQSGRGTWYMYNLITGTNTTTVTNVYTHIFQANGKYVVGSVDGTSLLAGPNITLVMTNGLDGTENLTWAQGANLIVYAGGSTVGVGGDNYVNPNGVPTSMIVFCAPSVTTFNFSLNGNGQFTGILVAPDADLKLNGGGKSNYDFCGCVICNSATFNGHFSFHYDEFLSGPNNNGRWLASSWNEVK